MKTLILMRHADADRAVPGQTDKERRLSPRGRLAASLMGAWLRDEGTLPDAALISGAARTRETWERLGFVAEAQFHDDLYLAEASEILARAQNSPNCQCLLILGHNPGMEHAMGLLAGGKRIATPPAATAVYLLPITAWRDAAFDAASLRAFETPKSLV